MWSKIKNFLHTLWLSIFDAFAEYTLFTLLCLSLLVGSLWLDVIYIYNGFTLGVVFCACAYWLFALYRRGDIFKTNLDKMSVASIRVFLTVLGCSSVSVALFDLPLPKSLTVFVGMVSYILAAGGILYERQVMKSEKQTPL